MQNGSHEAPVTRKRSAETDAERLEEEVTTAEADSERRLALKRKAEGDPDDPNEPEVEDSVMNSLAISWHRENDPDDEVDLLILQQRDCYGASVQKTVKNPRHLSRTMNAGGTTSTTRVLSRREEPKKSLSSEN